MKRVILACIAAAALVPLTAEGTALAQGAAAQDTGQAAGSSQLAASGATSTQVQPSNENISVRIMSPGNDGDVTQINSSAAASAAGNANQTTQTAGQAGAAQQAIGQDAHNAQAALSAAKSVQVAPSNENISVRIKSPGDSGDVNQVNASSAKSAAGNHNATTQGAEQSAAGGEAPAAAPPKPEPCAPDCGERAAPPKTEPCAPRCGGGKPTVQAIGQDAGTEQVAASGAISLQDHPVNANHGGSGGPVTQVNHSAAKSAAGNDSVTDQQAEQSARGGAPDMVAACLSCGHSGTVVQAIGQHAKTVQVALSKAVSVQLHPVNLNVPAEHGGTPPATPRTLGEQPCQPSKGEQPRSCERPPVEAPAPRPAGDVWQVNGSAALSAAGNANGTSQTASQWTGRRPVTM